MTAHILQIRQEGSPARQAPWAECICRQLEEVEGRLAEAVISDVVEAFDLSFELRGPPAESGFARPW